jgi:hypothetical protein
MNLATKVEKIAALNLVLSMAFQSHNADFYNQVVTVYNKLNEIEGLYMKPKFHPMTAIVCDVPDNIEFRICDEGHQNDTLGI